MNREGFKIVLISFFCMALQPLLPKFFVSFVVIVGYLKSSIYHMIYECSLFVAYLFFCKKKSIIF